MGKDRAGLYFFFYYPIGVEHERRGLTPATWSLMAAMAAIFVYFRLDPLAALLNWQWWVYFPQQPFQPGLALSVLNHAGWLHLLGNLIYLWTFGPDVERALGPWRFLLVFFFLGISANLCQGLVSSFLITRYAGMGVVGASGALSGLMGLFLLRYPRARIRTAWLLFSPLHGMVRSGILAIPSAVAIGGWILLQVVHVAAKALGGFDGTAYGAHLGGIGLGLLLAVALGQTQAGRLHRDREDVRRRLGQGDWMGAYEACLPLMQGDDPEDLSQAARITRLVGLTGETRELYRRAIRGALALDDEAGAAEVYGEALRFFPDLAFEEGVLFRLALALGRLGHEAAALRAMEIYRSVYRDAPNLPLILLRAARLEERQDPDRACRLYREQLQRFPESPYGNLSRRALQMLEAS